MTLGDEACDDGNSDGDDGCEACAVVGGWDCDADVTPAACAPVCGDGALVGAEPCDDAGTGDGDGCDSDCVVEVRALPAVRWPSNSSR